MSTTDTQNAAPSAAPASPAPSTNLLAALKTTVNPTAWVEFRDGILFELKYMPKARWRAIADNCTEFRYDPVQKQRLPKMDSAKFLKLFIEEAVTDWRGVTLRSISLQTDIDIRNFTKEQLDAPLPFSAAELLDLIDRIVDLDTFINTAVMDIKTFRPTMDEEVKN